MSGMEDRRPDADVVDFAPRRQGWVARRTSGWSRGTRVAVVVALVAVPVVGLVAEDRLRSEQEQALADCRAEGAEALRRAEARLQATADYLRPGLLAVPEAARDSLYVAMSDAAADREPDLLDARASCAAVSPSWFHPGLQERRDAYVAHLSASIDQVAAIRGDGRLYYRDTPELDDERDRLFGEG
jgi:hypothetical protein